MSTAELKAVTGQQGQVKLSDMKPKDQIAYLLEKKKNEIARMLPQHLGPERLMKVAQIAATTTPALAKCDVPSLVGAIAQCAQMGLEPNTVLGHAYLVPFNTKRKDTNGNERWVNSVQVIIGYKGLIDLARRSGQIISIAAHEVCENDKFDLVYGLNEKLDHTPALTDRGKVIGFYAVAKLKDGGHCFEFMNQQQIDDIRDKSQSAWKDEWKNGKKTGNRVKANSPWWDSPVEMGRKTVIRRLAKYLPLSIEFQTAAALDGMADSGKDQHLDDIEGDFSVVHDDETPSFDMETGEVTDEINDTPNKPIKEEPKSAKTNRHEETEATKSEPVEKPKYRPAGQGREVRADNNSENNDSYVPRNLEELEEEPTQATKEKPKGRTRNRDEFGGIE